MANDLQCEKCIAIRIQHKNRPVISTNYKLHGHTLETTEASKYFGVTISDNLISDRHIDNIVGKGNKTLGFIRHNQKDYTKPVKAAANSTIVRYLVEYTCTIWVPTKQAKIKAIEQVQKRAARFVNNYTDRKPGCVKKCESREDRRKQNRLACCLKFNMI